MITSLSLVGACGGGSSSSGGGVSTAALAGGYSGQFSITGTPASLAATASTETGTVTIEINDRARIVIELSNGGAVLGTISSDNTFSVTESAANATGDASCTQGTVTVSGVASVDTVNGGFSSTDLICGGLDITLSGTFQAARL